MLQSYFDLLGELMKFNVDAFKRFNKYINTDAKVSLSQGFLSLLFCPEVMSEPWSLPVFRCWFYIGGSAGRCQLVFISPCSALDARYAGMKVSPACGQAGAGELGNDSDAVCQVP